MILGGKGGFVMQARKVIALVGGAVAVFTLAASCAARQVPAPRVVDLTAADGTKLKATYFSAGRPGPGVLLLHQCNRDRQVWYGLADQLNAAGINVLALDYRGFGESGDVPRDKATPQQVGAE